MTKKSALTKPCKQRAFMCQPVAFHKLFVQKQELPKTSRNISFKSQGPKFGWSARPRYWECVKPAWLKKMVSCSVFSWSSTQPFGNPNMIVLPKGTQTFCVPIIESTVCPKKCCWLFKNMFQNIGLKNVSNDVFLSMRSKRISWWIILFLEPVLKHDWANRLRHDPATSRVTDSTQTRSARKKLQKNLWKLQIAEQNYRNKQCQITKKYRSHRSGGSKNVDANSKITYL